MKKFLIIFLLFFYSFVNGQTYNTFNILHYLNDIEKKEYIFTGISVKSCKFVFDTDWIKWEFDGENRFYKVLSVRNENNKRVWYAQGINKSSFVFIVDYTHISMIYKEQHQKHARDLLMFTIEE